MSLTRKIEDTTITGVFFLVVFVILAYGIIAYSGVQDFTTWLSGLFGAKDTAANPEQVKTFVSSFVPVAVSDVQSIIAEYEAENSGGLTNAQKQGIAAYNQTWLDAMGGDATLAAPYQISTYGVNGGSA